MGFDERAVDAEVLARHQPTLLGPVEETGQERRRDRALEQLIAVLREGRGVPDPIVDAEADKP